MKQKKKANRTKQVPLNRDHIRNWLFQTAKLQQYFDTRKGLQCILRSFTRYVITSRWPVSHHLLPHIQPLADETLIVAVHSAPNIKGQYYPLAVIADKNPQFSERRDVFLSSNSTHTISTISDNKRLQSATNVYSTVWS